MRITFIQTADAFGYKDMLETSSRTVVEYCRRHGMTYESYVGIKRGVHAWQASFNRIFMFQELLDRRHAGWAVYLDADAYIHDLDFDLRPYLEDKAAFGAILTPVPEQAKQWDVNTGVVFINLDHSAGREIVRRWLDRVMAVSDDTLASLEQWPFEINDQTFLFEILDADAALRDQVHFEHGDFLNRPYARFIRQILRTYMPAQQDRAHAVRIAVAEILESGSDDFLARAFPILISALYRVLLHRDPDEGGLENFRSRFVREGVETAFRETFAEFLVSQEYLDKSAHRPEPAAVQIRSAHRWILGRSPDQEELDRLSPLINAGAIDASSLRRDLLQSGEFGGVVSNLVRDWSSR